MRILHVTDFFPPVRGGLEAHVDDLAAGQADRGHDVAVATLTRSPRPSHPAVVAHTVDSALARRLPHEDPDRPFPPPVADPTARRHLRHLLAEWRPDVVHAHTWLGASLPARPGVPVVLTAHDYALICHLRTLLRTDGALCDGPSPLGCVACGARRSGAVTSSLMTAATAWGRRRWSVDRIITLSRQVRDALAPHLDTPIDVCGGLAPRPPAGAPPSLPAELPAGPFVLCAGDPGGHKGVGDLLDLWAGPARPSAPLVIAATRPFERALPPDVTVVALPRPAMAAAWARATVAVVPSRWHEPFGMVAMEALIAGTPVVASCIGALPEIVRDGVDGVLVPPGHTAALAAAVQALLDDEPRRAAMGAAGQAGGHRFSADVVLPRIEAVYAEAGAGAGRVTA